jgi:hypothetical protein
MEMKNFWKKITDITNLTHAAPTIITGTMNEPSKMKQKQKKQNTNAKANRRLEKRNKNIC